MLTGLIPPDSGSGLIEDYDICTDMNSARKCLGVCPQHDILLPDFTVYEHLALFAGIKGTHPQVLMIACILLFIIFNITSANAKSFVLKYHDFTLQDIEREVSDMITSIGLVEKRDALSKHLSG